MVCLSRDLHVGSNAAGVAGTVVCHQFELHGCRSVCLVKQTAAEPVSRATATRAPANGASGMRDLTKAEDAAFPAYGVILNI